MGKDEKTPRLRVKGYTETWVRRKLGELGTFNSNGVDKKTSINETPVNLLNYMDVYSRRTVNNNNTSTLMQVTAKKEQIEKNNILANDIFFTPTSETAEDIGHVMVIEETLYNTVYSYHLIRYRPFDYSFYPTFPNYVFATEYFRKPMTLVAKGVQRFVISKPDFENLEVFLPSYEEQAKISSILTKLDSLITYHQYKYDKLVDVKKSLIEKMFPSEEESTPKIRLKGYTEAWKQYKVADVCVLRGRIGFRGYTKEDLVPEHMGAITFSPSDIDSEGHVSLYNNDYISFRKYDESPEIMVREGDILFTKTASIGKIGYVEHLCEKATINPQFALITPSVCIDGYFMFLSMRQESFMKKIRDITGGSSIPTMSQEKIKGLTLIAPAIEEQKQISITIQRVDSFIGLQQRTLDKLNDIKKSLLERMFV